MNTKTQADEMLEIIYAAYATHIKVAQSKAIAASGIDADTFARKHWDQNLPGVQTLWTGLVKAVIQNVALAQQAGKLPPMLMAKVTDPLLPGLGAPLVDPASIPAGLARRMAAQFRGQGSASRTEAARDTVPGLAIGRCTEPNK